MKKRCFSLLLVMCMLLAVSGPTVYATGIQPYFAGVSLGRAIIADPGDGFVSCSGSIYVRNGYKVDLTMELMQQQGNSWDTIKTWETTGSGSGTYELIKNYYVASGYNYKVMVFFDVYTQAGTFVESGFAESSSIYH